jgi:threonine synthase
MTPNPAVTGLRCIGCAETADPATATHRCPSCGGPLVVAYESDGGGLTQASLTDGPFDGIGRYGARLPFGPDDLLTMGEGTTPLVPCPRVAADLGVGDLTVKDESQNPTGSVADRGMAVAMTAAVFHDAAAVALPTTGAEGHSAAAYAARAGLDAQSFVPSRAPFAHKAMINVHGGDMTVVEGRYGDAVAAFESTMADEAQWYDLSAGATPYRTAGQTTLAFEIAEQRDWTAPDAVVVPTGEGIALVGLYRGFATLRDAGLVDSVPALYAAQAEGCAPIVEALETDAADVTACDHPDTICGAIEVPDPAAGSQVLSALRDSDGGAVAVPDADSLAVAVGLAETSGLSPAPATGTAVAAVQTLVERGTLGPSDEVTVLNPSSGAPSADVLRSHLMSTGR